MGTLFIRKIRKYLPVVVLFLLTQHLAGQTDTEFWFAAPDITSGHCQGSTCPGGEPVYLRIANTQNFDTWIKISEPANPAFSGY